MSAFERDLMSELLTKMWEIDIFHDSTFDKNAGNPRTKFDLCAKKFKTKFNLYAKKYEKFDLLYTFFSNYTAPS